MLSGNDGLIKVWNADTLELKNTLTGHENEIRKLLPTSNRLYSGDMNGKVTLVSAESSRNNVEILSNDVSK